MCVRDSRNPILLDTAYNYPGKGKDLFPEYRNITFHDVWISGGGKVQFGGLDATHRVQVKLDGVELTDGAAKYKIVAAHADLTFGPGPVNFSVSGDDVKVSGKAGKGTLSFVPGEVCGVPGVAPRFPRKIQGALDLRVDLMGSFGVP